MQYSIRYNESKDIWQVIVYYEDNRMLDVFEFETKEDAMKFGLQEQEFDEN